MQNGYSRGFDSVLYSKKYAKNSTKVCQKNSIPKNIYRTKNDVFYYRKSIDGKDFRISLKTKNLKKAIMIKSYLNTLSKKELLMFEFTKDDYKFMCEYDTFEELKEIIQLNRELLSEHQETKIKRQELFIEESKKVDEKQKDNITLNDLEIKFIENKKKYEKVQTRSMMAYKTTFTYLKETLGNKTLEDISIQDLTYFHDTLIKKKLSNKSINNYIAYTKNFLDFAVKNDYIKRNNAIHLEYMKEEKNTKKENFTNKEIQKILTSDIENEYKDVFYVAAFTGMRINEILLLTNESVKEKDGIKFFDIEKSKTTNGVRDIPLHKVLIDRNIDFPIFKDDYEKMKIKKDEYGYIKNVNKRILRQLYSIILQDETKKTFHTFRGTFVNRLANKFPEKTLIIQEIVGHSKGSKALTIDTYAKGFDLSLKNEIIQELSY